MSKLFFGRHVAREQSGVMPPYSKLFNLPLFYGGQEKADLFRLNHQSQVNFLSFHQINAFDALEFPKWIENG